MSTHYSSYQLNTFWGTPYFQAHVPEDYPIEGICQAARAFRRLPPNVKELSGLARRWYERNHPGHSDIDRYYDAEGYELDPSTGERLTDEQIDAQWTWDAPDIEVKDIPRPEGGFPDPDTWEPEPVEEQGDYDGPSRDRVRKDIKSHGREHVARYYGVDPDGVDSDEELAGAIFKKLGTPDTDD